MSLDNQIGAFSIEEPDKKDFRRISDFYVTFKIEINKDFFLENKKKGQTKIGSERIILREPVDNYQTSDSKEEKSQKFDNRCSILNTSIDEYKQKELAAFKPKRSTLQPKKFTEEFKFSQPRNRRSSLEPGNFAFTSKLEKSLEVVESLEVLGGGKRVGSNLQMSSENLKILAEFEGGEVSVDVSSQKKMLKTSIHNISSLQGSGKRVKPKLGSGGYGIANITSNQPGKRSKFAFPDRQQSDFDPVIKLSKPRHPLSKPKFCLNVNNLASIAKDSLNETSSENLQAKKASGGKINSKISGFGNVSSMDDVKQKSNKFKTQMGLYDESNFQEKNSSAKEKMGNQKQIFNDPKSSEKLNNKNSDSMKNNFGYSKSLSKSDSKIRDSNDRSIMQNNLNFSRELMIEKESPKQPKPILQNDILKNYSMVPKLSALMPKPQQKEIPKSAQGKRKPSLKLQKPRLDSNIQHMNLRNYKTIVSLKSEMQLRSKKNYKKQQRQIIQKFNENRTKSGNNPFQDLVLKSSSTIESVDSCDFGALKLDKKYCALCGDDFRYFFLIYCL